MDGSECASRGFFRFQPLKDGFDERQDSFYNSVVHEWSLDLGNPQALRIAADARVSAPDYSDDQIWELALAGGDPPAIALVTSYGLRARSMRIFPGFGWDKAQVIDPARFSEAPVQKRFFPNYLKLELQPFADLAVEAEYWAPASNLIAGRFMFTNLSQEPRLARLHLHAILVPGESGQAMGESEREGAVILAGKAGPLSPVLFLTGGAKVVRAPYPGLSVSAKIDAGEHRSWTWVHAGHEKESDSFTDAKEQAAAAWDAEIAHLELINARQIRVESGNPAWDAALTIAQREAIASFVGPTRHLPHPSFVETRLPDQGFSQSGDGDDYGRSWNGQMALHAYHLVQQLLPGEAELAKGVLLNYLAVQAPDGAIDWKPGLARQRDGLLCIPLLATLAEQIYLRTRDEDFLSECFEPLLRFIDVWFTKEHDRDEDGVPEWDQTRHAGFDDSPSFARWHAWGQGLDISKAETPDLAAYLVRECQALLKMADVLGRDDVRGQLEERIGKLSEAVEQSWSNERVIYSHVERDVHGANSGELLGSGKGEFSLDVERSFEVPVRVQIRSRGEEGLSHAVKVFIHGRGRRGPAGVERLTEYRFQWFWEFGTATSEKTYAGIERIEVKGLSEAFQTELWIADYSREDQTLFLPLWAGIPGRERAKALVKRSLLDAGRFWRAFGVPVCSARDTSYAADAHEGAGGVNMVWNSMIGEGLLRYGFREQAAELVGRLLDAAVESLRKEGAFRESYNADQMEGLGSRAHVAGIAPLALFLDVLGVRWVSSRAVELEGFNPFPWPVTVSWRGLRVKREGDRTWVTFPDGQVSIVEGPRKVLVQRGDEIRVL